MVARDWIVAGLAGLAVGSGALYLARTRLRRATLRVVHQFRTRLARYHLQQRRLAKVALLADPAVRAAVGAHARAHGTPEERVWHQVARYIDEIVPYLNVLSYYKVGYNSAKLFVNLLYKVSVDYQDEPALTSIPRRDVVVYLMNHRSNADYVVVAYVLAHGVHVSYAVGEWARAWPLEYVFKSFGAYFIRRRFREPPRGERARSTAARKSSQRPAPVADACRRRSKRRSAWRTRTRRRRSEE